jgi:Bacteriocin-protection, YdeI or OmpD-Associated/Domain of unknown function (DUF1905)
MLAKSKRNSLQFLATIYRIWMMRHVDVPAEVADALIAQLRGGEGKPTRSKGKPGSKDFKRMRPKYVPVVAIVNGCSGRVTLMPAGGGRYRIQLNTALRKAARADVGDVVRVELQLDRASREERVPADLRLALKENPAARRAFDELTTGHRRHFIKWFDSAKGPDTRMRRLGQAIDHLLQRALSRRIKRAARTRRK